MASLTVAVGREGDGQVHARTLCSVLGLTVLRNTLEWQERRGGEKGRYGRKLGTGRGLNPRRRARKREEVNGSRCTWGASLGAVPRARTVVLCRRYLPRSSRVLADWHGIRCTWMRFCHSAVTHSPGTQARAGRAFNFASRPRPKATSRDQMSEAAAALLGGRMCAGIDRNGPSLGFFVLSASAGPGEQYIQSLPELPTPASFRQVALGRPTWSCPPHPLGPPHSPFPRPMRQNLEI